MKITAKGNSAWLVLTQFDRPHPVFIRTRDIKMVQHQETESTNPRCWTNLYIGDEEAISVRENYADILRALEVNLPTPGSELQTDDITQGS